MDENKVRLLILEELASILSDAYSATGLDAAQLYKRLNESINLRIKSIKDPGLDAAPQDKPTIENIQIDVQTPEDIAEEIEQTVPEGIKLEKADDETRAAYGIDNKDIALLIITFGSGIPGSTIVTWLTPKLKRKLSETQISINRISVDINENHIRWVLGEQMQRLKKDQE